MKLLIHPPQLQHIPAPIAVVVLTAAGTPMALGIQAWKAEQRMMAIPGFVQLSPRFASQSTLVSYQLHTGAKAAPGSTAMVTTAVMLHKQNKLLLQRDETGKPMMFHPSPCPELCPVLDLSL